MTSKVAAILHTFAWGNRRSVTEVARLTGLPPTTALRLLKELERGEILERSAGGMYQPGLQLRLIGGAAPRRLTIHRCVVQVMDDLGSATNASPTLAVLDRMEVLALKARSSSQIAPTMLATETVPAHATAEGKVLLAFSAPGVVNAILGEELKRFTPFTITDPRELRCVLSGARASMVAMAQRELDMNTVGLAVPVIDGEGSVIAALGIQLVGQGNDIGARKPLLTIAARILGRKLRFRGHFDSGAVAPSTCETGWPTAPCGCVVKQWEVGAFPSRYTSAALHAPTS